MRLALTIHWYDVVPGTSKSLTTALESHRTRRGSMLVETAIGIALAIVVMMAVAQLVALVAKQRHEITQSQLATQSIANVMERLIVLPWDELTTEAAEQFASSREPMIALDDPQLSITVTNLDDALPTKQIEIALSWRDHANRRAEPVRLVAWKHRPSTSE